MVKFIFQVFTKKYLILSIFIHLVVHLMLWITFFKLKILLEDHFSKVIWWHTFNASFQNLVQSYLMHGFKSINKRYSRHRSVTATSGRCVSQKSRAMLTRDISGENAHQIFFWEITDGSCTNQSFNEIICLFHYIKV